MHKALPECETKLDLLNPPLVSLVTLATIFQISMLSSADCGVRLHCLQNQYQDLKGKKKKRGISYVKHDTFDAQYVGTNYFLCSPANIDQKFQYHC